MHSFNLIDKPWIPCIMCDGNQQELGLEETLVNAHKIKEIFVPSAIVTVALHRLLLAIICRNFPQEDLSDWESLWDDGCFSQETIVNYFQKWHARFDLFHPEYPFCQRANFSTKKATPIKRLGWEFASGNNATLFDHSWDDDQTGVSPAIATRWVLATQAFAASAGKSETIHSKDSPWTRGAIVLMQGDNLFETLALNLLNFHNEKFPKTPQDQLTWEADQDWQPEHNVQPKGILHYLSWQSRLIHLIPGEEVKECSFAQGQALPDTWKQEPMYVYRKDDKLGLMVWQFQEEKAIWRDSHTLFNISSDAPYQIPFALRHIAKLSRQRVLEKRRFYQLQVIGQCLDSGQPTVKFWRQERLPVHKDYLNQEKLREALTMAIDLAEKVAKELNRHLYNLAQLLLAPASDQKTGRSPDKNDVKKLLDHFGSTTQYWAQLETPFKSLLVELPNDRQESQHEDISYGANELVNWAKILRKAALDSFSSITNSLDTSSRTLKAVAKVEIRCQGSISYVLKDYPNLAKSTVTSPTINTITNTTDALSD